MIISGVVVLYNPDDNILTNIKSYVNALKFLYVIDNSDKKNRKIIEALKEYSNIIYIDQEENKGIAYALNLGAKLSISNGSDWLLTMDQDSSFEENGLNKLIDFIYTTSNLDKIGLISPIHKTAISTKSNIEIEEMMTVMTSGNIINLNLFEKVGGFKEYYFIDAVDWEYCLNLNRHGFKVLRLNYISLKHNLGQPNIKRNLFGKEVVILNYNKIRRYYITRNKLLIAKEYFKYYPKRSLGYIKSIGVDIKNILLYEENKIEKLKYIFKGFSDFLFGKFGKLKEI